MVVYIVPHQELTEREHAQYALFLYIPPLLLLEGIAEHGEDELHINAMLILRKIGEHRHAYAVVLAQ